MIHPIDVRCIIPMLNFAKRRVHMKGTDFIAKYLPLIIPLVLVQLGLMIYCLIDLAKREKTKGPKWLWAIVVILGELIGPVIYLLFGRDE